MPSSNRSNRASPSQIVLQGGLFLCRFPKGLALAQDLSGFQILPESGEPGGRQRFGHVRQDDQVVVAQRNMKGNAVSDHLNGGGIEGPGDLAVDSDPAVVQNLDRGRHPDRSILGPSEPENPLPDFFRVLPEGRPEFFEGLFLSGRDVRQLQRRQIGPFKEEERGDKIGNRSPETGFQRSGIP